VAKLKKTVFLTGANGFIGTQIARVLLEDKEVNILAFVRAANQQEAIRKLEREWWDWPELREALGSRIEAVYGDITLPNLGMKENACSNAIEKVTHIIHTAADFHFIAYEKLERQNIQGTANVIEFAKKISKHHRLERFAHVSTAYVAGGRRGVVREDDLTENFSFSTDYERSKYEGELLVQAAKKDFSISIFRPSMVVGDSQTGAIKTFNTIYFPLRLYLTGRMRFIPAGSSFRINMVPVDYVAKAIARLTFDDRANGLTFHVTAPHESLPTLGELLDFVNGWARDNLGIKLPSTLYFPTSASTTKALLKTQRSLKRKDHKVSDALVSLAPYFSEKRKFDRSNIDKLLGPYEFKWQEIMPKLLDYAVYNSFFHRSDRTVHEQVLFRLESKSHPITYYDIVEGKIIKKTAQEMRQDILALTNTLKTLGITAGDRVALTGLNSTRYLAVDIAIGLAGAISVPLYYTTPPSDITEVLEASGAKLFFIGIPSLLARVKELTPDVPVVSICRVPTPTDPQRPVVSWDEFLSKGKETTMPIKASIGFGDIATLRYSSGTTGKPKGAMFTHSNLRYMAESTVSVLSWQARNRKCSYLSFLPMGHVVEGMLATYSPYYISAPVDIYFLEDFRKLQDKLPLVRPTIFFSVPRLYEKIWENIAKNPLGRFYIKTESHLLKRIMRRTLRNTILKRAGLDRCAQLISGSARADENLLENFRNLGIEIYNAYGMTEAPLVTMNRLGKNRLGTVGEPMPFTEVHIAEDGEIIVRGPQVTAGYFDKSLEAPFKHGWLITGDIGKITDEGSLVIDGRKKELIKTSYGKCIYSGKIEGLMRELPHVSEAMLLGESKPYCSALMWVDKKHYDQATCESIDKAVEEMNKRLSNPEKIKRWAVLINDLSIEGGELTPNLKLKRLVVFQKYAKTIESLYNGVALTGEAHIGGVEKPGD
jgi:long-chain acyl-CoA synthetase